MVRNPATGQSQAQPMAHSETPNMLVHTIMPIKWKTFSDPSHFSNFIRYIIRKTFSQILLKRYYSEATQNFPMWKTFSKASQELLRKMLILNSFSLPVFKVFSHLVQCLKYFKGYFKVFFVDFSLIFYQNDLKLRLIPCLNDNHLCGKSEFNPVGNCDNQFTFEW